MTTKNLAYHTNFAHFTNAWDERITLLGMTHAILVDGKIDHTTIADYVVLSNAESINWRMLPDGQS